MSRTMTLEFDTPGRGLTEITADVAACLREQDERDGLVHLYIRHTSASLIISENADPDVLRDLERYLGDLVPDGDPRFRHTTEGPDDMAAHVRSVLTATSLSVPLVDGRLQLGTWQGLFLWEHRHRPQRRQVIVTVLA